MAEMNPEDFSVGSERTLLVAVLLPNSAADPRDPVGELRSLAATAGAVVVDEMVAKRRKIFRRLYVGSGKAEEIGERAKTAEATCIIFDNDLSPSQIRELEEIVECKVLDRSELILDIFAAHAQTHQSRLQVELAQLEYTYPRLTHMWSHLERVAGGGATASATIGGIGTRGPGEKQIEIDRRLVQKRKSYLKRQMAVIDRRKVRQVRSRGDSFCVCLVGYTNAGKSTLMSKVTGAKTYIADKLFATLDTKTRQWTLADGQDVLLSDTVGFVRDLPHHLVASFRATLEEAIHADLLLHVADASHERVDHEIEAVEKVLAELGCGSGSSEDKTGPKRLLVLNKIDQIDDPTVATVLSHKYPEAIHLSAITGEGIDVLIEAVASRCGGGAVKVTLLADCTDGKLMQFIARYAKISSEQYEGTTARIEAVMSSGHVEHLRGLKGVQIVD